MTRWQAFGASLWLAVLAGFTVFNALDVTAELHAIKAGIFAGSTMTSLCGFAWRLVNERPADSQGDSDGV